MQTNASVCICEKAQARRRGLALVRTPYCCYDSKVGMVARVVYIWDVSLAQPGVCGSGSQEHRTAKNAGSATGGDRWLTGVRGHPTGALGRVVARTRLRFTQHNQEVREETEKEPHQTPLMALRGGAFVCVGGAFQVTSTGFKWKRRRAG